MPWATGVTMAARVNSLCMDALAPLWSGGGGGRREEEAMGRRVRRLLGGKKEKKKSERKEGKKDTQRRDATWAKPHSRVPRR